MNTSNILATGLIACAVITLVLGSRSSRVDARQGKGNNRGGAPSGKSKAGNADVDWTAVSRFIIAFTVLAVALYVVVTDRYSDDTQKWAFGAVGLILGGYFPTKSG